MTYKHGSTIIMQLFSHKKNIYYSEY